jgi:SPP1 gp7 family putative phage head morphogenesis protein
LAAKISKKRSQQNELALQQELNQLFQKLSEQVQSNLTEYWSDYQLLQGQINLITSPILEAHEEYYTILSKYNKREYRLGQQEAERLIQLKTDNAAMKSDYTARWKSRITNMTTTIRKKSDKLFGTIKWSEEDLLERVFTASQRTLSRVSSDINQIITKGYTDGHGINVVSNMLTKRFNELETWEAKRIARTEIHNSHNRGVMRIYNDLNVEYTQWIAADDDRTRDSHAEINGEIIPMGGQYSNGLAYPGDTSGPIEEWINCRCSNAPFVIPYGYAAPVDKQQFREEDLIKL